MKLFLSSLFTLFLLLAATAAHAQGVGVGGPRPGDVTNAPIDGGASLLLAAGAAYGLKKLRARRGR